MKIFRVTISCQAKEISFSYNFTKLPSCDQFRKVISDVAVKYPYWTEIQDAFKALNDCPREIFSQYAENRTGKNEYFTANDGFSYWISWIKEDVFEV